MTEESITNTFLYHICMIYRVSAVDIPGNKNIFYYIRKSFYIYCVAIHIPSAFFQSFIENKTLFEYVNNLNVALEFTLGAIATIVWLLNKKKMISAMKDIDVKIPECDQNFKKDIKNLVQEEDRVKIRAISCIMLLFSLTTLSGIGAWIFKCSPSNDYKYYETITANNITVKRYTLKLPLPVYFPFDYRSSKSVYFIVGFISTLPVYNFVFLCSGSIAAFISFTCFANLHLKILKKMLETVSQRCESRLICSESYSKANLDLEMEKEIKICAVYLNSILRFSGIIQSVYQAILLVEAIMSITFTAFCLILLPQVYRELLGAHIFFLLASFMAVIFFFCYFGSRLTNTSMDITYSLYNGDWLSASKSFKKSMLIIMLRMTKPVSFSMGGTSQVTLNTFVQIVKAGYSVLAVIKNVE